MLLSHALALCGVALWSACISGAHKETFFCQLTVFPDRSLCYCAWLRVPHSSSDAVPGSIRYRWLVYLAPFFRLLHRLSIPVMSWSPFDSIVQWGEVFTSPIQPREGRLHHDDVPFHRGCRSMDRDLTVAGLGDAENASPLSPRLLPVRILGTLCWFPVRWSTLFRRAASSPSGIPSSVGDMMI